MRGEGGEEFGWGRSGKKKGGGGAAGGGKNNACERARIWLKSNLLTVMYM
jgi:hypothetical protein